MSSTAPLLHGPNPTPKNAIAAILAAYDTHEFVAIPAAHSAEDLDDFLLQLIRDPRVPGKINAIVLECGNSLYQPILDRYMAGGNIPLSQISKVWRNTTQAMCGMSPFFPEFYELVRRINLNLPADERIRVLAGDAPIDWSKVKTPADISRMLMRRDLTAAEVAKTQIQQKHLKGLLLFGIGHIEGTGYIVSALEKNHPGSVFVVTDYRGFYTGTPLGRYNDQLEKQADVAAWPVPSILPVKHTWLASIPADALIRPAGFFGGCGPSPHPPVVHLSQVVDAVLYLGPRDLLLHETRAAYVLLDRRYMAELQRRDDIFDSGMGKSLLGAASEDSLQGVMRYDSDPFLYNREQIHDELSVLAKLNTQLRHNCPASHGVR